MMINWISVAFWFFAIVAVLGGLFVLLTKNLIHAAFALVITLFSVAAIFILHGADFLGVTQILIYVGGILVLLVFGIMLTNKIDGSTQTTRQSNPFWAFFIAAGIFAVLFFSILQVNFQQLPWAQNTAQKYHSTVEKIGVGLLSEYIFPFEFAAIFLLVVLIAAIYLSREHYHKN